MNKHICPIHVCMGLILRCKAIMLGQYGDSFNVVTLDCHNLLGLVPTSSFQWGMCMRKQFIFYFIASPFNFPQATS